MTSNRDEKAFETLVVETLVQAGGYEEADPNNFSRELAFDKPTVLQFIKTSQESAWEKLCLIHGEQVEAKFIQRLYKELELRGMLDVLRHGITDYGVRFKLAYFRPVTSLNPDTLIRYKQNILTVTRQQLFSSTNNKSIDLLLSLNGLPVATVELKNHFTGQTAEDAKRQYNDTRDFNELLFQFKKRALVHFAVDPDEAWMTTRLEGAQTRYLPFNKGHDRGAGNPPNPHGHRTAYLWEEIWTKDSWLEIVARFIHLERKTRFAENQALVREKLIFPRFHQLDVVRRLVDAAHQDGPGHNYLIQHSAGSGKSNSIAWLAYQLSSVHGAENRPVFNSVIVVSDRTILDDQLQDTIYQLDHTSGVVQRIDKDSSQLAHALRANVPIIITTLQKFPFAALLDTVATLPQRNYAIIVDEAHSSQGGETSKKMKEVLTGTSQDQAVTDSSGFDDWHGDSDDIEDEIRRSIKIRGKQSNLSFFAFTATPKPKTLEAFGNPGPDGKPQPFHLYSMRQAIEEYFILDVLQNYTTYKTFFRLSKAIEDDPNFQTRKVTRAIARFVSLHPHNLAQKTEVIIEHFRQNVMHRIGGKAKAMVVTSSRPHLVRYKEEFDSYIKEHHYDDVRALVAFTSFKDSERGIAYREADFNGFSESELPEQFATDAYNLLIVADKYQTGFDQPLLHTMYVDKRLSGVRAVQTLSRLNRTYPGKEDTFVLDFVNEEQDILDAFQEYYECTTLLSNTDPNRLYDLKDQINNCRIIWSSEIEDFSRVFFKPSLRYSHQDHAHLHSAVDPAVERFRRLPVEGQMDCKNACTSFTRLYAFLAQVMPFADPELEKFYAYLRHLLTKLPRSNKGELIQLNDAVALEYYRLQKIREGSINLQKSTDGVLNSISDAGSRHEQEINVPLSQIIDILNKRFGTDFTEADRIFLDQVEQELIEDEVLAQQARSNSIENFRYGFVEAFLNKLIGRMEANQEIFSRIMDDEEFGTVIRDWMLQKVYQRLNPATV